MKTFHLFSYLSLCAFSLLSSSVIATPLEQRVKTLRRWLNWQSNGVVNVRIEGVTLNYQKALPLR